MTSRQASSGAIAWLLTSATLLAAVLAVAGLLWLWRSPPPAPGSTPTLLTQVRTFDAGVAPDLRTPAGLLRSLRAAQPAALLQIAVLVLIATPLLRVVVAVVLFVAQRDWLYVVVGGVVLVGLALGLLGLVQ